MRLAATILLAAVKNVRVKEVVISQPSRREKGEGLKFFILKKTKKKVQYSRYPRARDGSAHAASCGCCVLSTMRRSSTWWRVLLIAVMLLLAAVSAVSAEGSLSSEEAEVEVMEEEGRDEAIVEKQPVVVAQHKAATATGKAQARRSSSNARIHSGGGGNITASSLRGGGGAVSDTSSDDSDGANGGGGHRQQQQQQQQQQQPQQRLRSTTTRRPLPIVLPSPKEHTKLTLQKQGLDMLRNIKGPVAPVVVIGPYRSGKSFLLNQLLGVPCGEGFGVGKVFELSIRFTRSFLRASARSLSSLKEAHLRVTRDVAAPVVYFTKAHLKPNQLHAFKFLKPHAFQVHGSTGFNLEPPGRGACM